MDETNPQLHTISSSLPQNRSSEKSSAPSERAKIMLCLSKLAVHYYRPDFTEGQAKVLITDMVNDLSDYRFDEIEIAARDYRKDAENKFFPRSGQLINLVTAERRERRLAREAGRKRGPSGPDLRAYPDGLSRPLMWWMKPRKLWKPSWREAEVPDGEMVNDEETGALRLAHRFS